MESDLGKLFIGGISWDTDEERLREYFSNYGEVAEAVIMRDRATGRARGFGFVVFADPAVAETVILDKHVIDGRTVEAKKAVPKDDQNILNRNSGSIHGSLSSGRTKKIFVGGLASTVTEADFQKYFDQFGTITDVVVMYDHSTQRPRGFGFITYDSEEAVDRVLHKTFHELNGKMVEVKRAIPKELTPGPNRSPLVGYNHGMSRASGFLNHYNQGYNMIPLGGYGARAEGRLSPIVSSRTEKLINSFLDLLHPIFSFDSNRSSILSSTENEVLEEIPCPGMSFFRGVVDYIGSIFSETSSVHDSPHNRSREAVSAMDAANGVPVTNERYASKLKGYFGLSKEEIAKAVRAEEWGLVDEAISHYQTAQRVLAEASSTAVPSYISSSEQEKVKSHRQKISKWQSQVSERLQALNMRAGVTSPNKISSNHVQRAGVASTIPKTRNSVLKSSSHSGASVSNPITRSQPASVGTSKSMQEVPDGYDPKLVEMINTAIVDRSPSVKWDDIAGLQKAKQALLEMVILPSKRRDLFTGLRKPARGLLLFGPPGNGKTMLAKAVASESEATFFNVSAASLTSKWVGEGEKLVRTLFMVAKSRQPSVIFMDEIDSVMSTRQANENEASRRLKSEFLVQFDGVTSSSTDLVIVIGATNKPQELDDAVVRRLVKRIYIPLPDECGRRLLLTHKLKGQSFSLPNKDLERLVTQTEGYSGSDLQALCEEAAMIPIRELGGNILTVKADQIRSLKYEDFREAMKVIRPSLNKSRWQELEQWNQSFGSN